MKGDKDVAGAVAVALVFVAPKVNCTDGAGVAAGAPKENAGTAENPDPLDTAGIVVDTAGVEVRAAPNIKGAEDCAAGTFAVVFGAPNVKAGVASDEAAVVDGIEPKAKGAAVTLAVTGIDDKGTAAGMAMGADTPNPVNPPNEGVAVTAGTIGEAVTGTTAEENGIPNDTALLATSTAGADVLNPNEEEGAVVVGSETGFVAVGTTAGAGVIAVAAGAPKENPVNVAEAAGITDATETVLAPPKEKPTLEDGVAATEATEPKLKSFAELAAGAPKLKPFDDEEGAGIEFNALNPIAGTTGAADVDVVVVAVALTVTVAAGIDFNATTPSTVSQDKQFFEPFGFWE